MRYRALGRTGLEISLLGFGASPLGEEFGPIDAAEGERAVHAAIDAGVNFFDTAPFYGRTLSETRLGNALVGRRDKVVLATKCCRYGLDDFDFSAARVEASIDESLRRLRTDWVDVLHIHDVEFGDKRQIIDETFEAARRVQQSGKARFIGVTGLQLAVLGEIAAATGADAVLSYARFNLANQDLDRELTPALESAGTGLINASPLLLGALAGATPPAWHPASDELLTTCAKAAEACREAGADPARTALRFCLDHPYAASTLVGIQNRNQLEANLAAVETPNDPALLRKLRAILEPVSNLAWGSGRRENWDSGVVEPREAGTAGLEALR